MDHAEDEAEFPEFLCVCGRGALCFWAGVFFLVVVIGGVGTWNRWGWVTEVIYVAGLVRRQFRGLGLVCEGMGIWDNKRGLKAILIGNRLVD